MMVFGIQLQKKKKKKIREGARSRGLAQQGKGWHGGSRSGVGWGGSFGLKDKGRGCRDLVSRQNRNFVEVCSLNSKLGSENSNSLVLEAIGLWLKLGIIRHPH